MTPDETKDPEKAPGAVDVVDGPIGNAKWKVPATPEPHGADPGIEPVVKLPTGIDNADRHEVGSGVLDQS